MTYRTRYIAKAAPTMATAKAPGLPTPATCGAALSEVEVVATAVSRAWIPNVVPVSICPLTVVVTVAGEGVAVVELQPDQVPVQLEKGPQPAVQVDHAQLGPPHAPLLCQPLPGPPHGPVPDDQPPGGPRRAPEQAETQELQPLPEAPHGPRCGPFVIVGQAEPPDVAENVASGVAVTLTPALAQIWAMAW